MYISTPLPSTLDPCSAGVHCILGSRDNHKYDYLVTSTLASQTCPAVGRALGNKLAHFLLSKKHITNNFIPIFPKSFVSYVSLGDGSTNNAHFLSGINIAEYATHNKMKWSVNMYIYPYICRSIDP